MTEHITPIMGEESARRMRLTMDSLMAWFVESVKSGLPTSVKRTWDDQIEFVIGPDTFTVTVALKSPEDLST